MALVVEALDVRKLEVVPHKVVMVANNELNSAAKILLEFMAVMVAKDPEMPVEVVVAVTDRLVVDMLVPIAVRYSKT